jgi:hypothetical protein
LGPASKTTIRAASARTAQLPCPTSKIVNDGTASAAIILKLPILEEKLFIANGTKVDFGVQPASRPELFENLRRNQASRQLHYLVGIPRRNNDERELAAAVSLPKIFNPNQCAPRPSNWPVIT